jgi:hypothetical protein
LRSRLTSPPQQERGASTPAIEQSVSEAS